jgi:hypothetical protein
MSASCFAKTVCVVATEGKAPEFIGSGREGFDGDDTAVPVAFGAHDLVHFLLIALTIGN